MNAGSDNAFVRRIEEREITGLPVVSAAVRRGDAIFFHDLMVHSSHPNTAKAERWSLISTYRDASVPDPSTTWQTAMLISGTSVNHASVFSPGPAK